jgi:hypothetical protein
MWRQNALGEMIVRFLRSRRPRAFFAQSILPCQIPATQLLPTTVIFGKYYRMARYRSVQHNPMLSGGSTQARRNKPISRSPKPRYACIYDGSAKSHKFFRTDKDWSRCGVQNQVEIIANNMANSRGTRK